MPCDARALSVSTSLRVTTSHTFTVRSSDEVARLFPSGLKARPVIASVCSLLRTLGKKGCRPAPTASHAPPRPANTYALLMVTSV
jgi:hypothetical protein